MDHSATVRVNKYTNSFVFRVHNTKDTLVKTVRSLRNYYGDHKTLGQHYTFIQCDENGRDPFKVDSRVVRRQYTVANCLRGVFYNSLVKALEDAIIGLNVNFDVNLISNESSDAVNVTLKNYRLKNGLSTRIHSRDMSDAKW